MEDGLAMMRAKAYASHPTIIEMYDKMAKLSRCAKHGTVKYFFFFSFSINGQDFNFVFFLFYVIVVQE